MKLKSRLVSAFLISIVTLFLFGLVEFGAFLWVKLRETKSEFHVVYENAYQMQSDKKMGYVLPKNDAHRGLEWLVGPKSKSLIYDVTYRTDEYGRRIVESRDSSKSKFHVLLFGCSLVYGLGLEDHDTLQYQLAQLLPPEYSIYNYAVQGYGTNGVLAQLQTGELPAQVEQKSGVAIYVYASFHPDRNIGSINQPWTWDTPYYFVDRFGKLQRKGSFRTGRPFIHSLNAFWQNAGGYSNFMKSVVPEFASLIEDKFLLTREIINASKQSYEKQFNGEFVTVLHPGPVQGNNIGLKDMVQLPIPWGREYEILPPYEIHPNGKANHMLAVELARLIRDRTKTLLVRY